MSARTKRLVVTAAVAILLIAYALLLWRGPWWIDGSHLREHDLQPADGVVITGFRTTLVALGAGTVAALGLWYTHKSHRQTERLFEHTRDKDREQAELTREGQVTERFVEGIKLLGSGSLTERLGGIYSLERIMRDSEKDHSTVVEVLAAFVRERARPENHRGEKFDRDEDFEKSVEEVLGRPIRRVPDDVQAAMSVLGRRPERQEEFHIDLSESNLQGATLSNARLPNVRLNGANLEGAKLGGANLKGARLSGLSLAKANMVRTDMSGAILRKTDLREAQLEGAILEGADIIGSSFHNAFLSGAKFTRAHISSTSFEGATHVDLEGAEVDS
ncbi:pentapeptide repeat-containing protein [Streptomyces angustmyceticus]|uniref:pentapeptide repeat-containing protein n=1 Tax=Streptomyces angustmyceticus TaxID=285578 RepID=UPI00344ED37E